MRVVLAAALIAATPVSANELFKGQTLTIVGGVAVGGGHDIYARALANHLSAHLPGNPAVVVKAMEGAGSRRAAEYIALHAAKDGTEIGAIPPEGLLAPIYEPDKIRYSLATFVSLGSALRGQQVCVTAPTSRVRHFLDTEKMQVRMGASSVGAGSYNIARMVLNLTRRDPELFKVVAGYKGNMPEILRAAESGEIDGTCGIEWSTFATLRSDWIKERSAHVLLQVGATANAPLPLWGAATDMRDHMSPEDREIAEFIVGEQVMGRPYIAPAGIPPDRLLALRAGIWRTLHDPAFLRDAERAKLEIGPVRHEEMSSVLERFRKAPGHVVQRARDAMR